MLGMAYDEDLANRIRELIADEPDLTEQRMFGGLAFLIGGHMSVAVSGRGGLLVRCDRDETDALLAKPHTGHDGHGRARDARLAAGRRRGREDQAPARAVGRARRGVRPLAAAQAMSAGDAVTRLDSFEHFEREHEAAYRDMPPVNVLVAGPTGVGKSTLVNAILRTPVAKTGKGRPVTEDIQAWSVPGVPDHRLRHARPRARRAVGQGGQARRPVREGPARQAAVRAPARVLVLRARAEQPLPGRGGRLHRGDLAAAAVDRRPHPGPRARGRGRRGVRDRGPLAPRRASGERHGRPRRSPRWRSRAGSAPTSSRRSGCAISSTRRTASSPRR